MPEDAGFTAQLGHQSPYTVGAASQNRTDTLSLEGTYAKPLNTIAAWWINRDSNPGESACKANLRPLLDPWYPVQGSNLPEPTCKVGCRTSDTPGLVPHLGVEPSSHALSERCLQPVGLYGMGLYI